MAALRRVGDVVAIPLGDGTFGFGQVLDEPLMAFFDLNLSNIPKASEVVSSPVAFVIFVMNYAITEGIWEVIGREAVGRHLTVEPLFFKVDPLESSLSIYRDSTGEETPATLADCEGLECAAVWEPDHVVDRLIDFFNGRPNKWVVSMQPKPDN